MIQSFTPDQIAHDENSVVSVGSFDGVHRAHRKIIETVVEKARERKGRSVIVTFDPHPQHVVHSDRPLGVLTTIEQRRALCEDLGVDVFCIVPFSFKFSRMSWETFVRDVIVSKIGVSEIVEGFNHHFGRDREGGVEALRSVGKEVGFQVTAISPVIVDGIEVSSTKIRRTLLEGDVEKAARLLGRPYSLTGTVVHGDKRGASMRYPTANIDPAMPTSLIPENGIYVVTVEGESVGRQYGLASVGVRPTFYTDGPRIVEVYILNHTSELYGMVLTCGFLRRLRGEEKFGTREELIQQMDKDKEEALSYIAAMSS